MKIMELCLSTGKPVIIQNVGEVLDPSVAPILEKAVVTIGACKVIKFNDKMVSYDPSFRLYLTTKLGEMGIEVLCLALIFEVLSYTTCHKINAVHLKGSLYS